MRRIARVYLWKEWREQRGALGVLALALLGCAGVAAAIVPSRVLCDPIVPPWIVGLSVLATLLAIGADLIPRERQNGALLFLERVPAGLALAFRAKLAFFLLALAGAFLYGTLLAAGVALANPGPFELDLASAASLWPLVLAIGFALWVFAVSAWMPNAALAVPATAFFLALATCPVLAVSLEGPLRASAFEQIALLALCLAGAPATAWASFVLGSRRGGSRARAACIGVAVASLFFSPAWAWAAWRCAENGRSWFEIQSASVGASGRFAFVNLGRRTVRDDPNASLPSTALIVDTETGAWRFAGEIDHSLLVEAPWCFRRSRALRPGTCERYVLRSGESGDGEVLLDARSAAPVLADEREPDRAAGLEPADFGLREPPRTYSIHWAGLGQTLWSYAADGTTHETVRDPSTGRLVERERIFPGEKELGRGEVLVRAGRWLVRSARTGSRWLWFDPESGASEPFEGLAPGERLGPAIDDGRFVLVAEGRLWVLDPDRGSREPIEADTERALVWRSLYDPRGAPLASASPNFVLTAADSWNGLALLDLRARTLRLVVEQDRERISLASSQGLAAITIEGERRIVRHDLEQGERKVLFTTESIR